MTYSTRLELGTRLHAFDADHRVVGFVGPRVVLVPDHEEPGRQTPSTWLTAELVQAPDFRVLGIAYDDEAAHSILGGLDDVRPDKAAKALALREHLNEAATGYKSGNPLTRRRYEPRPEYDPAKVRGVTRRLETKAAELGIGLRQIKRYRRRLREGGTRALVDSRFLPKSDSSAQVDPRVLDAMEVVRSQIAEGEILEVIRILLESNSSTKLDPRLVEALEAVRAQVTEKDALNLIRFLLVESDPSPRVDPRVLEAMEAVRAQIKNGETLRLKRIRSHVIAWLRTTYPECSITDGERGGRLIHSPVLPEVDA